MTPFALESTWAILGGLIPIIGGLGVFFIIFLAVREPPDDEEDGAEDDSE